MEGPFFVVVKEIKDSEGRSAQVPFGIGKLLEDFAVIFEEPQSLPPYREVDHLITFKGVSIINVHPYRYAHFQNNEIECQVPEMLESGTIHPSRSYFSSPVLLVKKQIWFMVFLYRL